MKWPSLSLQLLMLALPLLFANRLQAASDTDSAGAICPSNSENGCQKTCRRNCEELNNTALPICTENCPWGCECKQGYIFKTIQKKECVPYKECQVDCPKHMHFDPCTSSNAATCEKNAGQRAPGSPCDPWCVCDDGYVYRSDMNRTCVPQKGCSQQTKEITNGAND
ncbi:epidermal growth factor-like protein [Ambystoma mexicanum]|uniref:epidermal growth factor-like protein n=1 Tax=Ambystoma mexicanum TaxID=8296 RepID=UPI0037E81ABA